MIQLQVNEAKTFWQQTKGLLGTSKPHPLLLKTRWGIHTFGMKYPIDVIVLDESNKIVAFRQNLKPNRIFFWNPRYEKVLELPEEFIEKNKLLIGTHITLIHV